MMKYYAIGDIHGCYQLLLQLMEKIRNHAKNKEFDEYTIVFLGDYIDRGSENIKVLDYLMDLNEPHENYIYIKGNHEEMFMECNKPNVDWGYASMWVRNGGNCVMDELDAVTLMDMIPKAKKYVDWMEENLVDIHLTHEFAFVHAGLDCMKKMDNQNAHELRWTGRMQRDYYKYFPRTVVHGHLVDKKPMIDKNRIGIDLGSFCYDQLGCVYLDEYGEDEMEIMIAK